MFGGKLVVTVVYTTQVNSWKLILGVQGQLVGQSVARCLTIPGYAGYNEIWWWWGPKYA